MAQPAPVASGQCPLAAGARSGLRSPLPRAMPSGGTAWLGLLGRLLRSSSRFSGGKLRYSSHFCGTAARFSGGKGSSVRCTVRALRRSSGVNLWPNPPCDRSALLLIRRHRRVFGGDLAPFLLANIRQGAPIPPAGARELLLVRLQVLPLLRHRARRNNSPSESKTAASRWTFAACCGKQVTLPWCHCSSAGNGRSLYREGRRLAHHRRAASRLHLRCIAGGDVFAPLLDSQRLTEQR